MAAGLRVPPTAIVGFVVSLTIRAARATSASIGAEAGQSTVSGLSHLTETVTESPLPLGGAGMSNVASPSTFAGAASSSVIFSSERFVPVSPAKTS